jgi:hypothetical protein
MKILLLPFNIASKGPLTIDALNRIEGIEAKGVFVNKNIKVANTKSARQFNVYSPSRKPLAWSLTYLKKYFHVKKMIEWADVLHWTWDSAFSSEWDISYAQKLDKPGLIEWSGSDIRYPEKARELNPFADYFYDDKYEYKHIETIENSFSRQYKFSNIGFCPLVTPEMDLYLKKDLFPYRYNTLHRLNVKDFKPFEETNARPLIVHSPTSRVAKGTRFVIEVIESLKKEFDFDFMLIENMSRKDAMEAVRKCDIFIDQLLLGSHGMASCEAMSLQKTVVCYIMPAVYHNGLPTECPIVNANPDNLREIVANLLAEPARRKELGLRGREYAEKYLDVDTQVKKLVSIYHELIERKVKN